MTTAPARDPHKVAAALGVTITDHHGGAKGRRYPDGTISLRADLGPVNRRCTLAHELGHHYYDDRPGGPCAARNETRADRFAADLLITTETYRDAETIYGPHAGAIAAELNVTVHLVHVWRDMTRQTGATP